jgi:aconitate hydratase
VKSDLFRSSYGDVFRGPEPWQKLPTPEGDRYAWEAQSTYVKHPPYFTGMKREPAAIREITGARVLLMLGDSVTTDHISPAGDISKKSPAGEFLMSLGVAAKDFNSYGARRGNHEVMMRGTFANTRIKNQIVAGVEGGVTIHFPTDTQTSVYDAAMKYQAEGTPLLVLAGKEYGTGSSRDWAAKGPALLGIRFVIAESYERIHRSNLVGMGVLPLQFAPGQTAASLGLTGREIYSIGGLAAGAAKDFQGAAKRVRVTAKDGASGAVKEFEAIVRIDTPKEVEYYQHGGILPFVLRKLL